MSLRRRLLCLLSARPLPEHSLKVPVLTYHSNNVMDNTYAGNDHVALASDLRTLASNGWGVVPLQKVVDWHQGKLPDYIDDKVVALSFDDGSWFDYYDLDHPTCGMQRSFLNILQDFQNEQASTGGTRVCASSFVICSPAARTELDVKGLIGKGWWSDVWWKPAHESGLVGIECHSWDHDHPDLDHVAQINQVKGDFTSIETYVDCDIQVAKAGDYIQEQLEGIRPTLFAYPWGQASHYLSHHYFPKFQSRHGFHAAFTTEPRPVTKEDYIWALPRFVFGRDWKTPDGLIEILSKAG